MANRYLPHFHGINNSVDELAVFEVGAAFNGQAKLYKHLGKRRANHITYREIHEPGRNTILSEYPCTVPKERLDAQAIGWDVNALPYPFPDEMFDEAHCHMLTIPINDTERFAQEIYRILKPNGMTYLTMQSGPKFFFDNDSHAEFFTKFFSFGKTLENIGFTIDLQHVSDGVLDSELANLIPAERRPYIEELWGHQLWTISESCMYANAALFARKNTK